MGNGYRFNLFINCAGLGGIASRTYPGGANTGAVAKSIPFGDGACAGPAGGCCAGGGGPRRVAPRHS